MGWGSLISTIGGVVGSLIDNITSNERDTVKTVTFHLLKSGQSDSNDPLVVDAKFTYDDGGKPGSPKKFRLFNASSDTNDIINMTFPAIGDMGPETLSVTGRQTCAINDEFNTYGGGADSSKFVLEATSIANPQGVSDTGGGFKISSIGYNVPVDGTTERQIGSRISVIVSPDKITVKNIGQSGIINAIDLLSISGAGDSKITITNQNGQSGTNIDIPLSHELKCGVVDVSLTADFTNGSEIVREFQNKHKNDGKLQLLSPDEHIALLKRYGAK